MIRPILRRPLASSARLFSTTPTRAYPRPTNPLKAVAAPAVGSYSGDAGGDEHTLNSPSELARRISSKVLPKIDRPDVKRVMVVGSGGLSIGQAGEFDYSGEHPILYISSSSIPAAGPSLFLRRLPALVRARPSSARAGNLVSELHADLASRLALTFSRLPGDQGVEGVQH